MLRTGWAQAASIDTPIGVSRHEKAPSPGLSAMLTSELLRALNPAAAKPLGFGALLFYGLRIRAGCPPRSQCVRRIIRSAATQTTDRHADHPRSIRSVIISVGAACLPVVSAYRDVRG